MKLLLSSLLLLLVSATVSPSLAQQEVPSVTYLPMKDAPAVSEEVREELVTWMTNFQKAVHRMRAHEFQEAMHWRELVKQFMAPEGKPVPEAELQRLAKAMEVTSVRMLPYLKTFFMYDRIEIRKIDHEGDSATVVGRGYDADNIEMKTRWWLQRHEGKWKLVDHENVTVAGRFTSIIAQVFQSQPGAPLKTKEIGGKFIKLALAIEDGDSETAMKLVTELLALELPAGIREMMLLAKAGLLGEESDLDGLDGVIAELEKADSTNPAYFLLRAERSLTNEKYQDCISWARKYGSAIGHDADSWQMLVECHKELKQPAEALQASKDWVADYPKSSMAMYYYWQALPEKEQATTLRPLLSILPANAESFEDFGTEAYLNDDVPALKLLLEVMKELKMSKEDLEEWEASLEDITDAGAAADKPKVPETVQ